MHGNLIRRHTFTIDEEDDDASVCSGYVEVRAVQDPTSGVLKDEIMIVLPLPKKAEKELDDDPLYYYPPSSKKKLSSTSYDEDTASESDSSDEDDDFDVNSLPVTRPKRRAVIPAPPTTTSTSNKTPPAISSSAESNVDPALEYSFMEELFQTLDSIFGCTYGGCADTISTPVLKSALRRKGDYLPSIGRNVSFTKLEIREFNMTLGNHPSAVTGPPVMLDWESQPLREAVVDVDAYEKSRQPRRNRKQLKLSFEARRGILEKERGFTVEQVKEAWSEALKIRKQRQETRLQGPHQRMMDEIYESAVRKYNRIFGNCQQ